MKSKTSLRIKTLIEYVLPCDTVADVGCDHGYIPYYLLKNNICKHVILADISKKSLLKAKNLFDQNGLSNFADFRHGDGLSVFKSGEVDFCVIAGMGGIEIIKILQENDKGIKKFLLQPMKNSYELRHFLIKNGYKIQKDFIIFDKKNFYDIITIERGKDSLNELEFVFGKTNILNKSNDFIKYLKLKKLQTEKLLKSLKDKDRANELGHYLELIERAIN